jgi:hypothetical protein
MQEWEYIIYSFTARNNQAERIDLLNSIGSEGWELVAVFYNQETGYIEYTFKRAAYGIR